MILVALRERRGGAAAPPPPPPPPGHGGHVEEETSRCREIRCLRAWRGGASASPLPRVSASTRHRYRFLVLHHHRTKSPLISPRPSRRKSSRSLFFDKSFHWFRRQPEEVDPSPKFFSSHIMVKMNW